MTNKVKPFYIRITDDMTPQMVQDAFDKCVDAGAVANDGCKAALSKNKYRSNFDINNYEAFGVRFDYGTYIEVNSSYFGKDAQEITLDQLDEWLGLGVEQEWDGEYRLEGQKEWFKYKSTYIASNGDMFAICLVPNANKGRCFEQYLNSETTEFRKPETPEQKAELERLEAAYDLYCECVMHGSGGPIGFETFKSSHIVNLTWLRIVDKTGYRKQ